MQKVSESRFENTMRNSAFALLSQIFTVVLGFIVRRFFVQELGAEYLGISTSFSSILSALSIAELGVGSAIIFSLYKPIAENDEGKIKSLMQLYRRIYYCIGTAIFVIGVALIPFLDFFVKEMPQIEGIIKIYILLVIEHSFGYFFSYKINFLTATQQGYIVQRYNILTAVFRAVLQILALIVLHNYYVYLILGILCPLIKDLYATKKVSQMYPFLRGTAEKLSKHDMKDISTNIGSMFIYKVSQTISTTIDTLVVSSMIGIVETAIYSNYHLLINYTNLLFNNVFGAITPSIGNLMTVDDLQKKKDFFSALQMVYYWVSTYLAVGLIVLFNPLIEIWLGPEYLFSQGIVIALVVSVTLTNFQRPCALLRDANGLFKYGKIRPLIMSIINVVAAIVFVKELGVIGVVLATCLAKTVTFAWYDPYIVYKHVLKNGLFKYAANYIFHWAFLGVLALLCWKIYNIINVSGVLGFLLGVVYITIIVNGSFVLVYCKRKNFKYIMLMVKSFLKKIRAR